MDSRGSLKTSGSSRSGRFFAPIFLASSEDGMLLLSFVISYDKCDPDP